MSENITVNLTQPATGSAMTIDGQTVTLVKVEPSSGQGAETITEIQSYLDTFNKEIEGGDPNQVVEGQEAICRDGNTYYIDETGQYYYTQPVVAVVPGENDSTATTTRASENHFVSVPASSVVEGGSITASQQGNTVTISTEGGNPVLLNTGDGQFSTVTLMPQDSTSGEVSYVLIVQPPGAGGKHELMSGQERTTVISGEEEQDQDLAVYDFDDAEECAEVEQGESECEDDKSKIIKIVQKKTHQTVGQAHMCNYCNYISPKRYLLTRHMKSHSEDRPHKCSVCGRGFKTLASLQNHVNTHTGTKPHHCKFCDSAFTTSGELVRHVRYKHTFERPHKCTICDYASVELSKLRNHLRCHTGERPYQCPHCTYASPDTFKLKRHLRIHTGEKPYECEVCHARFTQSNSLKTHKLIHSVADKPVFKCELCPTTCGRKTDLRIHVQKLHTSDRPLKCKRCGKTFPDRYTYKVHNKTHDGEKCYRCDLCPYASVSSRHLETHMLIHTDQKPYQCELCDQAFRQKQLLKRHQNLYHTPDYIPPPPKEKTHECPGCSRPFRHKGNLIRHMAVHDPDSSLQEKQLALRLGRQKKVQFIDGQQVEVLAGDDDDDDDDELDSSAAELLNVNGNDGQQYVVLEVIQLHDSEGGEQALAVVTGDSNNTVTLTKEDLLVDDGQLTTEEDDLMEALRNKKNLIKLEKKEPNRDMDDCFGFVDEEEMEDEGESGEMEMEEN